MTTVIATAATLLCCHFALAQGGANVTVTPKQIDGLLPNPGVGWQTFHRFADEDANLAELPSTSAYFRLYWRELEPAEGEIDFGRIDSLLARARKAGQKLALRVMCAGTDKEYLYVPQWLKDKGCPGTEYRNSKSGPKHWVPDMDSALFQEAHFRLINELGKRYDGNPDFDLLDMGSVGLWGEWHMSGTGVDLPSVETRLALIDCYRNAFPKSPKVMLIGDDPGMHHAVTNGCGWRADCLGDMGGFSKTWNHMEHFYRQALDRTGAKAAWKTAPVAFESCWDMRKWREEGWDIRAIFDYALDLHCSYLNNKSAPIPEGTRPEIERFLRRIGYRLVVRSAEFPAVLTPGQPYLGRMVWENLGVAPPYRDYSVALRFVGQEGQPTVVCATDLSAKGWLPGEEQKVDVPLRLESGPRPTPGKYTLSYALVDPETAAPAVRLAIEGRDGEGWYAVGPVEVAPG
ncbi:MAG: hypothetical protein CO096_10080 [Armatimonadetes bacterium CG_4_9_14_3_um_filter_66_14]|nr:MAG: hypothetical protein COS65_20015 [Armatimonadetes bacterium CG06_land_8_20_14_3_00_66_21]PIX49985.1 MAG: hypothetical protein COZ57_01275 [Armatimonadetes bacterium CG_4_8_14_3_um_filter_66_20]PJB71219.1 MAG: hypothetical protein CO096_10080 [Armatimonadetes bacterium CG_4_9_14_3_um_filter_66_14]